MFEKEWLLVNENIIKRDDCYNLKIGGNGSWDHINNSRDFKPHNKKLANNRDYNDINFRNKLSKISMKKRMQNGEIPFKNTKGFTVGYTHSEETKRRISEKNKGKVSSTKGRL